MTIELSVGERLKAIEENLWLVDTEEILRTKHFPVYVKGHGIYLRDSEGKEYIDGTSGNWCTSLGHGNRKIIKAIEEQLEKIQYPPPSHSDVSLRLCQRIAEVTPGDLNRVSLSLHGSDANEAALSIARSYFKSQGKNNSMVIARWHGYHGNTLGAVSVTSLPTLKGLHGRDLATVNSGVYHMFAPYCYRCAYGLEYPSCGVRCAQVLDGVIKSMAPDNVTAFMGEPVLGAGGNIAPPDEYWPMIRQICDNYGILLIDDEVITGLGRTGKLFVCDHWGVIPDIMVTAKGLTGAYLPLAAVIVRDHVYQAFKGKERPFRGHTHSFYPAGAACALAAIDVLMEKRLWENAAKVGAHIKNRLEGICQQSKIVGTVHGIGLMLGLEIVEDKVSKVPSPSAVATIKRKCEDRGVLINAGAQSGNFRHILAICPPLIITKDESDRLCDALTEAIKETEAEKRE